MHGHPPSVFIAIARDDAFTLAELLLALCLLAALALVVPPATATLVNRERINRASADCARVARAIERFRDDTGVYPGWSPDVGAGELLVGPGDVPRQADDAAWLGGSVRSLEPELLSQGEHSDLAVDLGADPWGNRYAFNVAAVRSRGASPAGGPSVTAALWVISAGPNGRIETPFRLEAAEATLGGDDVGARVRVRP